MLVHPGMSTDRELARIRHAELLAEAAQIRTFKQFSTPQPAEAARRILLAASVAGLMLAVWLLVAL